MPALSVERELLEGSHRELGVSPTDPHVDFSGNIIGVEQALDLTAREVGYQKPAV